MSAHRQPPLNVWDYERLFEQTLDAGAFGYFTGGADDEVTLRDNVAAFRRWRLRPRMLVDVSAASIETTVLGTPVSMPLLVSPTAFQRMAHPDGEPAPARAVAAAFRGGAPPRRRARHCTRGGRGGHGDDALDDRNSGAGRGRGGCARRAALVPA